MPLVPRTDHLDDRMRKKIRKGEYVDLRQLLNIKNRSNRTKLTLLDGALEEVREEENLTVTKWVDAFVIYMSVYLEFYQNDVQGMLRHIQIVKRMCSQGKNGIEYDTQFRRMRAQHSDIRWGEYLPEMAAEIEEIPRFRYGLKKTDRYRSFLRKQPTQKNVCYKFNSPEGCKRDKCYFPHKCRHCLSSNHPDFRCLKK